MDFTTDPGSEVLKKLSQRQFKRQQENTQEELSVITSRIKKTLNDYEECSVEKSFGSASPFNEDLKQMEALLKDSFLKNEYQQKLSVLIFGYKDICLKRMEILSQISECFDVYALDENEDVSIPDSYVTSENVDESINEMEKIFEHLDGTSRNVLDYMAHMHRLNSNKSKKNKKKLEKTISQNKQEIEKINTKLQNCEKDISERDDKIKMLRSHLDSKRAEVSLHNQQMAALKNNFKESEENWMKEIRTLRQELSELKDQELKQDSNPGREVDARLQEIRDAAVSQLRGLKERVDANILDIPQVDQELAEHFRVQLKQMHDVHCDELDGWRQECIDHVREILDIKVKEEDSLKWMKSPEKEKLPTPPLTSNAQEDQPDSPHDVAQEFESKLEEKSDDEVEDGSVDELVNIRAKFKKLQSLYEQSKNQMKKLEEDKIQLVNEVNITKKLQEDAEMDAMVAMRRLDELGVSGGGEAAGIQSIDELSSDEKNDITDRGVSPSTFSKPTSPNTGRSLVSAYRQKIADRRDFVQQQKVGDEEGETKSPQSEDGRSNRQLEEQLRCYRAVAKFKDKLVEELIRHPNHHEKASILTDIPSHNYDTTNDHVQLHMSRMSASIETSLEAIFEQLRRALSHQELPFLQQQVNNLQEELAQTRGVYERRSQHDAAMIMHMQNTLSETQRGNTTAAGTSGSGFPSSPAAQPFGKTPGTGVLPSTSRETERTILFTRQDARHNEIALKKTAAVGKITQETLESVTNTMAAYNAIPARRMRHLASKLLHHTTMKTIETNVRNSNLLTSEVFAVLEKMETLQQRRAQQWARDMDSLTLERQRLAMLLFDALQRLESLTGVFLIKPVVSYRGKGPMRKYPGKISTRFNKYQVEAMLKKMIVRKSDTSNISVMTLPDHRLDAVPMSTLPVAPGQVLSVSGFRTDEEVGVWQVDASFTPSTPKPTNNAKSPMDYLRHRDMPRLVELDVNRYQTGIPLRSVFSPNFKNTRFVKTEGMNMTTGSRMSQVRGTIRSAPSDKPSPDYKSSAPPTTPASPLIDRFSGPLTEDDDVSIVDRPLPPIRKNSRISSTGSYFGMPASITTSRSAPDVRDFTPTTITPLSSARKDMATSPVGN